MFEFRFYSVAPGRMASELALVHDMGFAGAPEETGEPPAQAGSLWDRYGVHRPLGSWAVLSGRQAPGFLYIIRWNSMKERDERFPRFWTDPFWRARRAELTDGQPLVDSIETWLLEPSAAWRKAGTDPVPGPVGGVHELRIENVLNGSQAEAADSLGSVDLPALRELGARLLGVFEVTIGPERPRFVTLLAWPDLDTQQRAWFAMDRHPVVRAQRERERRRHGRDLFGPADAYLLEPISWNLPHADLGVAP
jgi:hypothetical protein